MQPKQRKKQVIRLQQSKKETEILEGVIGFRSHFLNFQRKSGEKVRTNMLWGGAVLRKK